MTDQTVSTTGQPLWTWSATALAAAIRVGELSSVEVIEACLRRIDEVNPDVNAATVVFHDRARQAARRADEAFKAGAPLGPLHGVPFSVKENVDLTWSATTAGVPLFKDAVPATDSVDVQRLRDAGAIPIIRTNMPDFGMRWHTDNALFGATVNPWDPRRTPGGSSGGEGAAIATGMSPLGVGNDYGGSIRLPAYANGICGLKPTPGRIPMWRPAPGVFPGTAQAFAVQGPLARTVDDVALGYRIMRGPCDVDPLTVPALDDPYAEAPRRVALVANPAGSGTAPSVLSAVMRAADALRRAGWEVEETEPPHITEAAELWRLLVASDLREFLFHPETGMAQHFCQDMRRYTADFLAHTGQLTLEDYGAAMSRRIEIRSAWSAFQQTYPVVLAPVCTDLPFQVGRDLAGPDAIDEICHSHRMLVAISCLGLPSLALPVGSITAGMPDGVQLIGPAFGEELCITAASTVERTCGGVSPLQAFAHR